ncbi:MAG: hypothetical protein RLZZ93_1298, partial [Actinomycetota bacterium]
MTEQFGFGDKVALVAGGTGGIGSRVAALLASRGAKVTTVSRATG